MKVIVLMSTYNGEKFLREQIESVLAQDITQTAQLQFIVRDDGSSDSTTEILREYQEKQQLTWSEGNNLGSGKSFWQLLQTAPQADFYAFCDQDDYWFPDKLSRAVKILSEAENQNQPLLYCSAFTATNSVLEPFYVERSPLNQYTDFAHALLYSTAPGCTFVFNRAACQVARCYDMNTHQELLHDWLMHKIVTIMGGRLLYDAESRIFYRQHGNNTIGVHNTGFRGFATRIRQFLFGNSRGVRSSCARALLDVYGSSLAPDVFSAVDYVANYATDRKKKRDLLKDDRFRTHSINDLFLKCLILINAL